MSQPDIPTIDDKLVQQLRGRLRGQLLTPADTGYDAARRVWNGMIDRRPALVARCLGVEDIVHSIAFAREQALPLTIKGGGHNIAGLAVADGALMLDMSLRRGVWVDRERRLALAQNGCLLGDVDRETQLHGLAAVLGFVSETGVTGLTLGGGFGYLSRRFGWSSDNVRAMEMVAADGRRVRASENENEDLFWALRGGGGNFGVVTGIEYRLHPVGPEIVGGAVAWHAAEIPQVLDLYRRLTRPGPPELAVVLVLRIAPPAPWIAPEAHGKPIVMLLACHSGSVADAERDTAPIKSLGKPVGDVLIRRPYVTLQNLLDATQPKGRRYYWKSEYLPEVSDDVLAGMTAHAEKIRSPHSAVIAFPLGGAIGNLPDEHSAVGNRGAAALFNITAAWDNPDDDAANIAWARDAWSDLRRFSTGGTYVNFINAEEGDERTRDAYGANFARLAGVKAKWDPENFFRVNRNVAPRASR